MKRKRTLMNSMNLLRDQNPILLLPTLNKEEPNLLKQDLKLTTTSNSIHCMRIMRHLLRFPDSQGMTIEIVYHLMATLE